MNPSAPLPDSLPKEAAAPVAAPAAPHPALLHLFRWCLNSPEGQMLLRATQRFQEGPTP